MSGRIRTIKPEWLEDELLLNASDAARVLSVALMVMADDYGRGRAGASVGVRVWPASLGTYRPALDELAAMRFIVLYEVNGQKYYEIRNWDKHQRVDKPGKPRVPAPSSPGDALPKRQEPAPKVAYFIRGTTTGLIKIGESIDPVSRLAELAKCGSESLELLAIGGVESRLHQEFASARVYGEWFRPSPGILSRITELGGSAENPIATVCYEEKRVIRTVRDIPAKVPGDVATSQEILAPDHDQEGRGRERGQDPKPEDVAAEENRRIFARGRPVSASAAETLAQKAARLLTDSVAASFDSPAKWPEVQKVARDFAESMGLRQPRLGQMSADRGVSAIVALIAAGFSDAELEQAASAAKTDAWLRDPAANRGLSSLSVEVVRRLLEKTSGKQRIRSAAEVREDEELAASFDGAFA